MTRLIVARHGGSVRAQAKPGEGATFTVLLSNPPQ
jgi:signal transduction histidine kinase